MKRLCLIILYLSFILAEVMAQPHNFIFKNLNRATGLPVDEVNALAQDSSGFIWIGSREGLFRYDGFNYKGYYYSPDNKETIPNNYISKIHVDKKGRLWVATLGGAAILNDDGKVLSIFNSIGSSLFSKEADAVYDIQEDRNNIWLSTADGLFKIDLTQPDLLHTTKVDFKIKFNFATNQLGPFTIDSKGRLWICTLKGLVIFNPLLNQLFHKENNPGSLKVLHEKSAFRNISLNEKDGQLFYSTWEPSVRLFDINNNKIRTYYSGKTSNNPDYLNLVNQFLRDGDGNLWVASGKGIKIFKAEKNTQHIVYQPGNEYSISSNLVNCLLKDREGSLWLGTTQGISTTRPFKNPVVNISVNNLTEFPFANEQVNNIIPVNFSENLVSTQNGIYRTDSIFQVLEHYTFGTNKYDWTWTYYRHGDHIYISTQGGNLLYETKTRKLKKLTEPPFDKFYPVFSFAAGKDRGIWMSQYQDNFLHYNPQTKNYKIYNLQALGEASAIVQLSRSMDSTLWVLSTSAGAFKFNEETERFTERLSVSANNGLMESNILFFKDLGREIIIGYVSKGISLYDKTTKRFSHFGKSNGLASNSVTDVLHAGNQTVWIATRNGLSRLNLKDRRFENFSYENGILQNDFKCLAQLPNGRIAAGTVRGLIYFHPEKLRWEDKLFAPIITGINVHGNEMRVDSFTEKKPLRIAYNKNYFSIDYISPQYINNQQVEYEYKLDGFNKNWVAAGQRRFASYSNVPGGDYTLRIRARFPGGEWVEKPGGLPVVVHAAFYKTIWFFIACAIFLAAVMYLIFRYRLRQVLLVEKMRASISSDLHDEVGASLTSISIFSEMAKQSVGENVQARQYLKRIGDRSRESIEKMSDIIWSINPENDSLQQMLTRMKNFVNETVDGKDILLHWKESGAVETLKLGMEERKNFYLLFKEATINAVKYADAKNITVAISFQNNLVSLEVKDDGKGFDYNRIKPGNGIKNIRQRAVLLGGHADVTSSAGNGTCVSVIFSH